jgi:hypothetical protein
MQNKRALILRGDVERKRPYLRSLSMPCLLMGLMVRNTVSRTARSLWQSKKQIPNPKQITKFKFPNPKQGELGY